MVNAGSTRFLQFCIQCSSLAILYYDYVLTFGMEVQHIWRARFRISTILYVWCRYAMAANLIYLLTISNKINTKMRCWLQSLQYSECFWPSSHNQTYAIYDRNRGLLAFLSLLGLACMVFDLIGVFTALCKGRPKTPISLGSVLSYLMVFFEISATGLALVRNIQALKISPDSPWRNPRKSLYVVLFEQGILYFSVATSLTIASLILNVRVPGGFFQRLLNAFTLPVSGLLTARFLLHLRAWEYKQSAGASINDGNGGEPLAPLRFAQRSKPHDRGNMSTFTTFITSHVKDYGEDPVHRAKRARAGLKGVSIKDNLPSCEVG
ncbi:hypothetical protein BDZ94DRAFT_802324 [Collybia nuda]|uniref:DUF6533 domain-containing protein n=1 Tax=Collybia nuda TaxID=64659 RepID=A0A9P6CDD2_9AGAR|nr:hypothetical protein BDZ94DRAFT_802324 [Collybia nuda]